MAQTTTNYGLLKPEATDSYNHLIYDNPNMDTIDAAMKANADAAITSSTCIKSGTVHSVIRSNTSCPVFRFTATGDWITGDTMNVDGTPVSVFLPNGTAPLTGCYVINTEVMAIISGSRVTLLCPVIPDASDISFDNSGTTLSGTDVEAALKELNDAANVQYDNNNSVKDMIDTVNAKVTDFGGISALPNVSGRYGLILFTLTTSAVTSDSFTVPAGTRFMGNCFNGICHGIGIENGSSLYMLRAVNDTWTHLATK